MPNVLIQILQSWSSSYTNYKPVTGYKKLVTGHEKLVTGHEKLVTGHERLVTGHDKKLNFLKTGHQIDWPG
jgi:hypothetical protein